MLSMLLLLSPDASAGDRRGEKLSGRAEQALIAGESGKAWELAGKAREHDDDNPRAVGIQAVLLIGSATPDNPQAAEMLNEGMVLMDWLLDLDPESPYISLSHSILQEVTGPGLITESTPECSAEADEQLEVAEGAFRRRDMDAAGTHYRRALSLCPEAAPWWTYYGDVWYSMGDYDQARENYQKSLDLDPCYWPAHRFWADTLLKEGNLIGARDRAALAVACNPEYDIGWRFLEVITEKGGGTFRWSPIDKPPPPEPDAEQANIIMTPQGLFSGAAGLMYQISRTKAEERGGSPLEVERSAVELTLTALPGGGEASGPLWLRLSEAQDAGYLDEAIFIFLLDEALLPEFLAYRTEKFDRLSRYITELLAPM
ncbi:MAG: tetratricopeptide (TPR) repeat protein [Myxococcota bacterium]|jgi:tetratricopeptide (TPR) repeat protein